MSEVGTSGWHFPHNINTTSWLEAEDQDESYSGWQGSAQTCNDSTWTALTMNNERFDPEDLHNTSTYTTRVSAPADGDYLITGCVYETNSKQDWRVTATRLVIDGTVYAGWGNRHVASGWPSGHLPMIPFAFMLRLSVANYIEIEWYQRNTPTQTRTAMLHLDMMRVQGENSHSDPT